MDSVAPCVLCRVARHNWWHEVYQTKEVGSTHAGRRDGRVDGRASRVTSGAAAHTEIKYDPVRAAFVRTCVRAGPWAWKANVGREPVRDLSLPYGSR